MEECKKDQILVPMTCEQHEWFMQLIEQHRKGTSKKLEETKEKFNKHINGLKESGELIDLLLEDVKSSLSIYSERRDDQFMRRNFVRTFFAAIEGHIYRMKQDAILYHENEQQIFKPEEVNLLKEKSYEDKVDKQGKANRKEKDTYISFLPNFRFSIECYIKSLKSNYNFDFSSNGWECLQKTVEIRNNITHPKSVSNMKIEDSDMEKVNTAFNWYIDNMKKLLSSRSS
jgi:hypothetical protein